RHIKGGTGEQWNIEGVNLADGGPHDGGDCFERAGRADAKDAVVIHDGERLAESVARQGPEIHHAGAIGPPEGGDCKVGSLGKQKTYASLKPAPGRGPRSTMPVRSVHRKAWIAKSARSESPTTVPTLLISLGTVN